MQFFNYTGRLTFVLYLISNDRSEHKVLMYHVLQLLNIYTRYDYGKNLCDAFNIGLIYLYAHGYEIMFDAVNTVSVSAEAFCVQTA